MFNRLIQTTKHKTGEKIMSIELKIKSKHLSEEARIIRFEEQKLRRQVLWLRERQQNEDKEHNKYIELKEHRRWDVRNENRATFIARAYLAGKPYSSAELKRKSENEFTFNAYIIPRVVSMVNRYGPKNIEVTNKIISKWAEIE